MSRFTTATLSALILLAGACKESPRMQRGSLPPPLRDTLAWTDTSAFSLRLETAPSVKHGEPVPLLLIVRNVSNKPAYLATGDSGTTFDLRVKTRSGAVVWNRMSGRESLASLVEHTLAPGQEVRFSDTWRQISNTGTQVPPGAYELQGTLDVGRGRNLETVSNSLSISAHP